jgi:hypothetical protein
VGKESEVFGVYLILEMFVAFVFFFGPVSAAVAGALFRLSAFGY